MTHLTFGGMNAVSHQTCFLIGARTGAGMRYLAGPVALVPQPDSALRFVSEELARRSLPTAQALAHHLEWRILRAEVEIRHEAV